MKVKRERKIFWWFREGAVTQPPPIMHHHDLLDQVLRGGDALLLELLRFGLEDLEEQLRALHLQGGDVLTVVPREDRVPDERLLADDGGAGVEARVVDAQTLLIDPHHRILDVVQRDADRLHEAARHDRVHRLQRVVGVQFHDADGLVDVGGDQDGGDGGDVRHGGDSCPCGATG